MYWFWKKVSTNKKTFLLFLSTWERVFFGQDLLTGEMIEMKYQSYKQKATHWYLVYLCVCFFSSKRVASLFQVTMEADLGHALIAEQIIAFAGMSHKVPREMWSHSCIGSIKSKIRTKRHFGCKKHVDKWLGSWDEVQRFTHSLGPA